MTPEAAATRWARVWTDAWQALDPDPIVALYAPGAYVWIEAFRPPASGPEGVRAYLEAVFPAERAVRARFGVPLVHGDRAAVEWWAELEEEGTDVTLSGVSMLRFDALGQVTEQRDSWSRAEGRRAPDQGWGRGDATRAP